MTTRRIHHEDAASAASLVQRARARRQDLIDPFPPAREMEVLADMGARQDEQARAWVALEGDDVVGYGALDYSPEMRRALLIGPVVDLAHRNKGYGLALLDELVDHARVARQKYVRVAIGEDNAAAETLLRRAGFRRRDTHTCVRLKRPKALPKFDVPDVKVTRVEPEDDTLYYGFTCKFVPRIKRQTRSLLKSDDYIAILAHKRDRPVGCVEVDLRFGDVASIENLDAPPSLLHKGLGNALVGEAMRAAFERESVTAIDLLLAGEDDQRVEAMKAMGFEVRHKLVAHELRL